MTALWQMVKDEVRLQLRDTRAFIALAGTETDGRLTIRRITEASAGSEQFARLAGEDITEGDEIVCIIVGGKPLVLGKLQRTAPTVADPETIELASNGFTYKALQKDLTATTISAIGMPAPATGGTLTTQDDDDGLWLQHETTAVSGNTAYLVSTGSGVTRTLYQPDTEFTIKTPATITDIRIHAGLYSDVPFVSSPTVHALGFRYGSDFDAGIWRMFRNDNSSTGLTTTTGIAIAADTLYTMRIQVTDTDVNWYINGALAGTLALSVSNMPGTNAALAMMISVQTLTAAARSIKWGRFVAVHRP